jgi:hypothetical protein
VAAGVTVAAADGDGLAEEVVAEDVAAEDGVAEDVVAEDGVAEDVVAEGEAAAPAEQARVAAAQAARPPKTVSALRPAPADIRPPAMTTQTFNATRTQTGHILSKIAQLSIRAVGDRRECAQGAARGDRRGREISCEDRQLRAAPVQE